MEEIEKYKDKYIGKKYQRQVNEPYIVSSFHFSSVHNKFYISIHPIPPNPHRLQITEEVGWFFDNYSPIS
jgi:hypothetical protein